MDSRRAAIVVSDLVRYTAPSLVFERGGQRLVAGGWQPELAYDLCIANLDPTLERSAVPDDPAPLLDFFPDGLTTAEVAGLLAVGPEYVPDAGLAEEEKLARAVGRGDAVRVQLGGGALWRRAAVKRSIATGETLEA